MLQGYLTKICMLEEERVYLCKEENESAEGEQIYILHNNADLDEENYSQARQMSLFLNQYAFVHFFYVCFYILYQIK